MQKKQQQDQSQIKWISDFIWNIEAKEKPIIEKVDAFLSKPFTADSILRILAEVLNS